MGGVSVLCSVLIVDCFYVVIDYCSWITTLLQIYFKELDLAVVVGFISICWSISYTFSYDCVCVCCSLME